MSTVPINFVISYEQPFVTGELVLEGLRYRMTIRYTPRRLGREGLEPNDPDDPRRPRRTLGTFRFTLFDAAGGELIGGERLRIGTDLWRRFKSNSAVPQGNFNVCVAEDQGLEPTRGIPIETGGDSGADVGRRVRLEYVPVADLS